MDGPSWILQPLCVQWGTFTKHALTAFIISSGARPEDASGGVPANFSQMRQGSLAALRERAEQAKGGRMQRGMTLAVYKSTANAAEGFLTGDIDVEQLVNVWPSLP